MISTCTIQCSSEQIVKLSEQHASASKECA